jgi:hypothetical protein
VASFGRAVGCYRHGSAANLAVVAVERFSSTVGQNTLSQSWDTLYLFGHELMIIFRREEVWQDLGSGNASLDAEGKETSRCNMLYCVAAARTDK